MNSVSDVKSGLAIAVRAYHSRSKFVGLSQPLHWLTLTLNMGWKRLREAWVIFTK